MNSLKICLLSFLLAVYARAVPLTVATYNVENYTLADRMVEGGYRKDYPKPELEKTALRAVIRRLDADVLALQEIGGEPFLTELQRDLKRDGMDYPYAVVLVADDKDRKVAVLSKRPFTRVLKHVDLSFKYFDGEGKVKRGLLEVRLATDVGEVALFVVHLKSRYTERPDDLSSALQRAGEAVAIRDCVLSEFPDPATALFMIAGDFNDTRPSRPVQAMLARGKTKITEWMPAADDRGETWTHCFRKEDSYSRVDHILVSPGLRSRVRGATGLILAGPEVGLASDHRPVSVVIE
ncbi:MAG: endonuclease/exonuclease/phosphatase family protein [Opitutaceae bacterium]|jgi:endonuclease/exonuclease/phosphatase family metal-dependent hydrolase